MAKGETRIYPTCCQSAYCGSGDCKGCKNLPRLEEFTRWKKETEAVRPDWIWSPSVWEATK